MGIQHHSNHFIDFVINKQFPYSKITVGVKGLCVVSKRAVRKHGMRWVEIGR